VGRSAPQARAQGPGSVLPPPGRVPTNTTPCVQAATRDATETTGVPSGREGVGRLRKGSAIAPRPPVTPTAPRGHQPHTQRHGTLRTRSHPYARTACRKPNGHPWAQGFTWWFSVQGSTVTAPPNRTRALERMDTAAVAPSLERLSPIGEPMSVSQRGSHVSPSPDRHGGSSGDRLSPPPDLQTRDNSPKAARFSTIASSRRGSRAFTSANDSPSNTTSPQGRRPSRWSDLKRMSMQRADDDEEAQIQRAASSRLSHAFTGWEEHVGAVLKRLNDDSDVRFGEILGEDAASDLRTVHREALDSIYRWVLQHLADFADGEVVATRASLKMQAASHQLKLETSRTAGEMKLKNQAAELEGSFNRQLESKMVRASASTPPRERARADGCSPSPAGATHRRWRRAAAGGAREAAGGQGQAGHRRAEAAGSRGGAQANEEGPLARASRPFSNSCRHARAHPPASTCVH
jgi:hypothetical protein